MAAPSAAVRMLATHSFIQLRGQTTVGYALMVFPPQATDVTFNIKDFKCMVHLCEMMPANMILRFAEPGHPLIIEPHLNGNAIEVASSRLAVAYMHVRLLSVPAGWMHGVLNLPLCR